ncbi:hypothetical protein [Treponema sp.]|uniref:hypothetical protein n=1 Tax=Treponema sp. TaxID=166 RepID=UPI0025D98870|nr:hypothetical protein [Treponema sp.]MBR4322957.1 hypothetical protein [Treponema sp.]
MSGERIIKWTCKTLRILKKTKNFFDKFSYDGDSVTTEESENKYERLSLKVGGSIINIGKASMRIKAGLFYQWDWEYNHNEESWFHSGKFIFGVGMKNLY